MKKINLRKIAIAAALLAGGAAISGYALSTLTGPTTSINNASVVNGGAHLESSTFTAKGSRVGPPIYRLSTSLSAPDELNAKEWDEYR